ncbi:MAG TPA: type II secretion system F family protein [Candidatus Babeliales bacterium]|nr:type II secretion system F family protein [Candidatus Babeliales bacterium]
MPYFKWVGTDIAGVTKKGKQSAHSPQDLSNLLLRQGVALLHFKFVYVPSFLWLITAKIKGNLFQQKAKMLRAGLLLPNVFAIAAQQSHNPLLYDILSTISCDIQQGSPFDKSLEKHPYLCDRIVMAMLIAGNESGNLIGAMENVALYYHKQYAFSKSIRSVLAMPLLTLLFFIGISLFIFIFIIPRFVDMFSSLNQELPALTRTMISMSEYIRSVSMVYTIGIVTILLGAIHYYFTKLNRKKWDAITIKIPFIGSAVWQHWMGQSLQALALLVNSGTTLVAALKIVSESVDNSCVQFQFETLYDDVSSGQLLSNAMAISSVFLPEVVALVLVGEETSTLGQSLESAASVYSDRLDESLRRFVFFLQPLVILLLGFLVTILIFAVYLPIMQLSHIV